MSKERRDLIEKLRRRLDDNVAGTKTAWIDIEQSLDKMPLQVLRSLEYRIDRALASEYARGEAEGSGGTPAC